MLGRRVNRQSAGASLLVAKPCGDVPHEGGVRFARDSLVDEILAGLDRARAPGRPDAIQRRYVRSASCPTSSSLRPGQKHQLQLIAEYTDGTTRDVTRLGIFTANNTQFAEVDDDGLVTAGDAGRDRRSSARFERTFAATGVIVLRPGRELRPTPVPHGQPRSTGTSSRS